MIPAAFEYLCPKTIPEAIGLLQQRGEDAKILSGGQSLIPMMKFRLARPAYLVDINRIAGLSYIREEGGYLNIGGLTREADLRLGVDPGEISDSCRHVASNCGSANPEPCHSGRQPCAW